MCLQIGNVFNICLFLIRDELHAFPCSFSVIPGDGWLGDPSFTFPQSFIFSVLLLCTISPSFSSPWNALSHFMSPIHIPNHCWLIITMTVLVAVFLIYINNKFLQNSPSVIFDSVCFDFGGLYCIRPQKENSVAFVRCECISWSALKPMAAFITGHASGVPNAVAYSGKFPFCFLQFSGIHLLGKLCICICILEVYIYLHIMQCKCLRLEL